MSTSSPTVTDVTFTPAREIDVSLGLLGFIACTIGPVRIDSITLRRTSKGLPSLRFPTKQKRGREFQIVWPANEAARIEIEHQILDELERQGVLA